VWDYALERYVIPVSPNTLYAYLTVIVYGLRGLQIEQKTKEILNHFRQLQIEFEKLHKDWGTLGSHLKHAGQKYEDLDRLMTKYSDRLNLEVIPPADALPASNQAVNIE
jgi:DNA recombination protein RmuC